MKRFVTTLVVIVALAGMAGCGKEESSSSSSGGSGGSAPVVDASKPLEGSAPSRATQFIGTWMALNEGEFVGMEFMKDGKVLVTNFIQRAMGEMDGGQMFTYSVLEGGRLSLERPDGRAFIYNAVISGDQLELKGQAMALAPDGFQRFKRLPAGKTLEVALKEQAEAEAKAYRERSDAVVAFLKQPNLVLEMNTATNRIIALDLANVGQTGFDGKAWHEGNPPHLDEISGQLVRNDRDKQIRLQVNFGRQLEPPVAGRSGGGNIGLDITGNGNDLKLAGKVQFGAGGTPVDIVLKSDTTLHAKAVKSFNDELARIAAIKKPIIDALKDYAVLTGTSGAAYPNPNEPPVTDDRIVLVKGPQPGTWVGQGGMTNRRVRRVDPLSNITAVVDVVGDKPMLIINSAQRQYQLTLDSADAKKLDGGWFIPGNQQGKVAEYTISEAMDSAARAAQIEQQKKILTSLGDTPYIGLWRTLRVNDSPYELVSISFKPAANGAVTGLVTHVLNGAAFDFQAQVVDTFDGPVLRVVQQYTGNDNALAMFAQQMRAPWDITVGSAADGSKLNAFSSITKSFELVRADDAYRSKQKQALTDAMKGGMKFVVAHPVRNAQANGALEMKLDPGTGKITGTVTQQSPNVYNLNSAIEGELKEENGHLVMAVQITDPQVGNRFRATYVANYTAWLMEEGWIGATVQYPTHQTRARSYVDIAQVK